MKYMQIDFLQPVYTLTFSNGLIACLVFMGIGSMCDIGYVLERPFTSMTIALFAEAGTVLTYPIARLMGLDRGSSAAVSIIGGTVWRDICRLSGRSTDRGVKCVPDHIQKI